MFAPPLPPQKKRVKQHPASIFQDLTLSVLAPCTISNIPCDNEISTWIWFVSGQFPFHWGFKYRSNFGYAKYGIQENVGMILEKYIQA